MDNVIVVDWLLLYHQLVNSGFVSLSEVMILDLQGIANGFCHHAAVLCDSVIQGVILAFLQV
jgi:hypothetical protein